MSGREEMQRRLAFAYGRRLTCSRCKAQPGARCVTKTGNKAGKDHGERFYPGWSKAADAGWQELGVPTDAQIGHLAREWKAAWDTARSDPGEENRARTWKAFWLALGGSESTL